jgi:asparagine synthase (glutamine-hydrolysing)
LIAAVLDDSPARHARAVAALVDAAGVPSTQSTSGSVTLLAWGAPTQARVSPTSDLAWVGEPVGAELSAHPSTLACLGGDFALLARSEHVLRAARGYFGGRSLYYSVPRGERSTIACSRLGPLVRALGGTTLDRPWLALTMAGVIGQSASMERSPFEQIRRLCPGQILELGLTGFLHAGSLRLPGRVPIGASTPEEIAEELGSRLRKVVARYLAGLKRVAILASGGVDSSAIVAACVRHVQANGGPAIDVLTVDVPGPGDDRPYFDLLCRELGVTPVRFRPIECAPYMRRIWTLDATPNVWPNGGWEWPLLEAARARGAEVVLTGIGGDDAYEGDPRLFAEEARRGHLFRAVSSAARLRTFYRPTAWGRVRDFVLRPLVTPWIPAGARRARLRALARRRLPWGTAAALHIVERESTFLAPPPAETGEEHIARLAVAQHLADPVDARASVEGATGCLVRDPLFAPELMELVASIPPRLLLYGDQLRGLFRQALRGLVPDPVRLRTDKASFEPALTEMLAAAGGLEAFRDLATARELARLGLVESIEFERVFRSRAGAAGGPSWSSWSELWPVLALEEFARAHGEGRLGSA